MGGVLTGSIAEEWRPCPDYEGTYEVSNLGSVRRSAPGRGTQVGKIRKQSVSSGGYQSVGLSFGGVQKTFNVHGLVARAFLGPCPEGLEANHIDGIKSNCSASNLEYITHSLNQKHAYAIGIHPSRLGEKNRFYRGVPTEYALEHGLCQSRGERRP